jgi:hypothetical protein
MEISQIRSHAATSIFSRLAHNSCRTLICCAQGKDQNSDAAEAPALHATLENCCSPRIHIMAGGNYNIIVCERGIRTFETYTRNTMDISAIPVVHKLSHLPIAAASRWNRAER